MTRNNKNPLRRVGEAASLNALRDAGFLDAVKTGEFNLILFHIRDPSLSEIVPFVTDVNYFPVKYYVNDSSFFDWDPAASQTYFEKVKSCGEVTIPKLNAMAYE